MSKCFITKLPSSVDNDNLPVLGQLRIKWLKQDNLTNNDARTIGLQTIDSITVKVSGAHFTDSTLTSNDGNAKTITATDGLVWLYVSNDVDAFLTIDNKYSLNIMTIGKPGVDGAHSACSASFDIEDIGYCTNLISLGLTSTQVSGDISAVSKLTNLINMHIDNTAISGDISAVSNLVNLYDFTMSKAQVSGDISAVSKLTNLTGISLNNTQVSGNVDSLAGLTKLRELSNLKGISLTGDMSKIPANVRFIGQTGRKITTNFTWTANGRQNAKLLAMEGPVPFDTASMDNMLIDQATCTFDPVASTPWYSVIRVSGIRTSASDAAVETLQSKGVTITGVTKAS